MNEHLKDKLKQQYGGQLSEAQFEEILFMYEQYPEEFQFWDKTVEDLNSHKVGDAEGPEGEKIMDFLMRWEERIRENKVLAERRIRLGLSLQESIRADKLSQFPLTPESNFWIAKAAIAYWIKRWDQLSDKILKNLKTDPEGRIGKEIAEEWNKLIERQLISASRSFTLGVYIWQNLLRVQNDERLKTPCPPKELLEKYQSETIGLLQNPDAFVWLNRALAKYVV